MGGEIFISYRRDDSKWSARALHEHLVSHFGVARIFIDVDGILPAQDFAQEIEKQIVSSEVLLVIIGPLWISLTDDQGKRRLDNPQDYVRMEIRTALLRKVQLMPILVDGATVPKVHELPDDIKPLVQRNALEINNDRFSVDSARLVVAIKQILKKGRGRRRLRQTVGIAIFCTVLVLFLGTGLFYWPKHIKEEVVSRFFADATKDHPWSNSLGMQFVPVAQTHVLFSVWDARVKDFQEFVTQTHYNAGLGWKEPDFPKNTGFKQSLSDPVVSVSWIDATEFCAWLTKTEKASGRLPNGMLYRMPTDQEWSSAVGLSGELGSTPAEKNEQINVFPWGSQWPPPQGAGNYCGEESKIWSDSFIEGYRDDYVYTSPVGSFPANQFGLFDMGGNVWQWCQDRFDSQNQDRVLRGASWNNGPPEGIFSASFRFHMAPGLRFNFTGFRCVVAQESAQ